MEKLVKILIVLKRNSSFYQLKQEIKQNNYQNSSSKNFYPSSSSEYQSQQLFNIEESEEIMKRCLNKVDDVFFV